MTIPPMQNDDSAYAVGAKIEKINMLEAVKK